MPRYRPRKDGSPIPPEDHADPIKVADAYALWVMRGGFSPETKRAYIYRSRAFCTWLAAHAYHQGEEVFADSHSRDFALREYRDHLLAAGRAPAGADAAVGGAVRLTTWLGLDEPDPLLIRNAAPRDALPVKALTPEDATAVLRAAEARGPRDLAVVVWAMQMGLRVGELHRLNVDDVHLQRDAGMVRVLGKGGRIRDLPVPAMVRKVHGDWMHARSQLVEARNERAVFIARGGGRLATRSMHDLIAGIGSRVGIEGLHPHQLRHTLGRNMVDSGAALRDVQEVLGHSHISTAQRYTTPSMAQRASVLEAAAVTW